ncbi:MAG: TrkH family potassium uptake protein, partial [Bacteroidetes bacterium]
MRIIKKGVIINILGFLLIIESGFMLLSAGISLFYGEGDTKGLLFATLLTFVVGGSLFLLSRN